MNTPKESTKKTVRLVIVAEFECAQDAEDAQAQLDQFRRGARAPLDQFDLTLYRLRREEMDELTAEGPFLTLCDHEWVDDSVMHSQPDDYEQRETCRHCSADRLPPGEHLLRINQLYAEEGPTGSTE